MLSNKRFHAKFQGAAESMQLFLKILSEHYSRALKILLDITFLKPPLTSSFHNSTKDIFRRKN